MSHTINGNPATYPSGFTAPDDGESRDAAANNVGLEALADRTEYLRTKLVSPPNLGTMQLIAIENVLMVPGASPIVVSTAAKTEPDPAGRSGSPGGLLVLETTTTFALQTHDLLFVSYAAEIVVLPSKSTDLVTGVYIPSVGAFLEELTNLVAAHTSPAGGSSFIATDGTTTAHLSWSRSSFHRITLGSPTSSKLRLVAAYDQESGAGSVDIRQSTFLNVMQFRAVTP